MSTLMDGGRRTADGLSAHLPNGERVKRSHVSRSHGPPAASRRAEAGWIPCREYRAVYVACIINTNTTHIRTPLVGDPQRPPHQVPAAKLLYVQLKLDYTKNPDVKNLDDFKMLLGEKRNTSCWSGH